MQLGPPRAGQPGRCQGGPAALRLYRGHDAESRFNGTGEGLIGLAVVIVVHGKRQQALKCALTPRR